MPRILVESLIEQHETSSSGPSEDASQTSLSLLERARTGDGVAWQKLIDVYAPYVFLMCRNRGLSLEDSADTMQETFHAVFRALSGFRRDRAGDGFRRWLRTVAHNKIRDYFRRRQHRPQAAGGSRIRFDEISQHDEESSIVELSIALRRVLDNISAEFEQRTWNVFWKTVVEQMSNAAVAEELGLSSGAVRQARYRVLKRLREELGEIPAEDDSPS